MNLTDMMAADGFIPADHNAIRTFPVEMRPLHECVIDMEGRPQYNELAGWRRVVRADTNETLHVHTNSYKLVTHEDVSVAIDEAIRKAGLDTNGMMVRNDMAANGARLYRCYTLPAHTVDINRDDYVALQIVGINSYDGSMGVSMFGGGYRFLCANMAKTGNTIAERRSKHTKNFDIRAMANGLVEALNDYLASTEQWRAWAHVDLNTERFVEALRSFPAITDELLGRLARRYVEQDGRRLWDGYNVLTAWATHEDDGSRLSGHIRMQRQERVHKFANSPKFLELAAA